MQISICAHTLEGVDVRWVYDLHIAVLVLTLYLLGRGVNVRVVVAKLQESLNTSAGVLGTLTVVAVGQVHDKACALEPLPLAGGDELVDDALCVVGEIAELCLPDRQVIWGNERVTELKA